MASSAVQEVVGQIAAGGDSLRQSPWITLIYQGLRALINLMPGSYQINQYLNQAELQLKRRELFEFTGSFLYKVQAEGHIKWRYRALQLEGIWVLSGVCHLKKKLSFFGFQVL